MTTETFRLWEGDAPGAQGSMEKDIPTITVYQAKNENGQKPAMVVLPGGGYRFLAKHEGPAYAEWLAENGYTSFEVKYRLASDGYHFPCMLLDAARAVRWVRAHAEEYEVDPERVGAIGSSAGGHLLACLATQYDEGNPEDDDPVEHFSSRPTLGVLCYAPVSMDLLMPFSHLPTFLLGENPSPEQVRTISPEKLVNENTPPCFMMHTVEDEKVNVMQSLIFGQALHQHGVPFEVHIYEKGKHGLALGNGHPWTVECLRWLHERFGD